MSRFTTRRLTAVTAIGAVMTLVVAVPFGAWAQQNDRGGMLFQLRLAERFQTRDSTSPDPDENGTTNQFITDLDLSFSSETRTEAISLDFGAGYRLADGPTTDGFVGTLASPTLSLSYSQDAATASLDVTVTASQVQLSEVSPLDVSTSEDRPLASDFAELTDGGTRQQIGFDARLSLRDDAPFGLIFGLGANDISFTDLPAGSGLQDRSSLRLTTTGRFDVTKVLQVRAGLQYDFIERDGEDEIERFGFNGRAVLTRPDGNYRVLGNFADGDGGAQAALTFGRRIERPNLEADFALGMTRSAEETLIATGSARFAYEFGPESALGTVTATADRDVSFASGSEEEIVTSLSLASSYAISPLASLSASAQLAQSEGVVTGDTVDLAQAGVNFRYDFAQDWRATAGVTADWRDPSDDASSESTTISLTVSRSFDLRR